MADCPSLPTCPFFIGVMENMPSFTTYLKTHFCEGEYSICARFMVFQALGKGAIPRDLFPNEPKRAYEIISKARRN